MISVGLISAYSMMDETEFFRFVVYTIEWFISFYMRWGAKYGGDRGRPSKLAELAADNLVGVFPLAV
jgi:hypothetical protein